MPSARPPARRTCGACGRIERRPRAAVCVTAAQAAAFFGYPRPTHKMTAGLMVQSRRSMGIAEQVEGLCQRLFTRPRGALQRRDQRTDPASQEDAGRLVGTGCGRSRRGRVKRMTPRPTDTMGRTPCNRTPRCKSCAGTSLSAAPPTEPWGTASGGRRRYRPGNPAGSA